MIDTTPRTILLVNQSPEEIVFIRNYFSRTTRQVRFIEAETQSQALEFIETIQFDCIILGACPNSSEMLPAIDSIPLVILAGSGALESVLAPIQPRFTESNKDEFIATVSHDLRNPLNSILGYTRLLRMQNDLPDHALSMLEIIERNGKTQLQLINDLVDTARILNDTLKLAVRPLDLAHLLHETVRLMRPLVEAKAILFTVRSASDLPTIEADPERLQQIIFRLISNAIKFTPQQGKIALHLWHNEANVYLQVVDDGMGIEPDFLPIIFERFALSEDASYPRQKRLGLGLPLVKHLVELHGGTIKAESPGLGKGATFTISLPAQISSTVLTIESDLAGVQLAEIKLLVIEDDQDSRELLQTILADMGAIITLAASGQEAIDYLTTASTEVSFDLLISDINLPDEDGYSLLRKIRKLPHCDSAQLPAIALTAFSSVEDRIRCLRAGFQTHVSKPIDPLDLATTIQATVNPRAE